MSNRTIFESNGTDSISCLWLVKIFLIPKEFSLISFSSGMSRELKISGCPPRPRKVGDVINGVLFLCSYVLNSSVGSVLRSLAVRLLLGRNVFSMLRSVATVFHIHCW